MKLAWCGVLLAVLAFSFPAWAEDEVMDDAWWERQFDKVYETDECIDLNKYIEAIRALNEKTVDTITQTLFGWNYWLGECVDQDIALAERVLSKNAERGTTIAAIYMAQIRFLTNGENSPETMVWGQRAKDALIRLPNDWKQNLYIPLKDRFKGSLSPRLEEAFSWYATAQNGPAEFFYETGKNLLDNGSFPESKVLACLWLSKAEKMDHVKARFELARQLALGDGIRVASRKALFLLRKSADVDQNVDAYLLAAQLQQKGDVFEKNLPNAYFSLLRAQNLGAEVSEQLTVLKAQLTSEELKGVERLIKYDFTPLFLDSPLPHSSHPSCLYSSR